MEQVLIQHLEQSFSSIMPALPPGEQAELDALAHLSDDALWTISREQMPQDRQNRMAVLMYRKAQATSAPDPQLMKE